MIHKVGLALALKIAHYIFRSERENLLKSGKRLFLMTTLQISWCPQLARNAKPYVFFFIYSGENHHVCTRQDVAVDEVEIRSKYDSGTLGKVCLCPDHHVRILIFNLTVASGSVEGIKKSVLIVSTDVAI